MEKNYCGVEKQKEGYSVRIRLNGKRLYLGEYDNPEVAASVYNYVAEQNNLNRYNINVPRFNYEEAKQHYISKQAVILPVPDELAFAGKSQSQYVGIRKVGNGSFAGNYRDQSGKLCLTPTCTNEEAAAVLRDHYIKLSNSKSKTNVTTMSISQACTYRTHKGAFEASGYICDIVK